MKLIKDEIFNSLSEKANAYDNIVQAITAGQDLQPEDLSADILLAAISERQESNEELKAANDSIRSLKETVRELTAAKQALEAQVDNLLNTSAESPAAVYQDKDAGAVAADITAFADKHSGDILAIAGEMKRQGFV